MSDDNRLGLTQYEVDWLHSHRDHPTAQNLIRLYGMVRASPADPGARGIFAAALDDWRKEAALQAGEE